MSALRVYVACVALIAVAATAAVFMGPAGAQGLVLSAPVLALAAGGVIAQFFPVVILREDGNEDIETSHAFVLAVLLIAGPVSAIAAQLAAIVVISIARSRPPIKNVFNVAQTTAATAAAGLVLVALTDVPAMGVGNGLTARELAAFLLAAGAYMLINEGAVSAACALADHRPVLRFMAKELRLTGFHAATSATAPLAAAGALVGVWLVPVLLAPLLAFRRSAEAALATFEQARRDALTGLPNAVALREAIAEASSHRPIAVAMLDLDGFKEVNDTLGHRAGDELLRAVAERLGSSTTGRGRVFRLQGDEFVTLLDEPGAEDALLYADGLQEAFQAPFLADGLELEIGLSAGVALAGCNECAIDELLRRADVAMYQAKHHRLGFALYSARTDTGERARQIISAELRRALATGEIEVHYQPQISLRTGNVLSAEALVRWRRPDGALVPPGDFIPQAEHTGVIQPLTLHVLRTALTDLRRWSDELGYEGRVGINLSARTLHHPGLVADVRAALAEAGVEPARLELEITESALMADPAGAHRTLAALHDIGVDILIDDFGTGYSSLAYLGSLPVDGVKIDRSFVKGMAGERTDAVIVNATVDLGHNLGLRVIAEGVEDAATRDRLVELECDLAQGWLWSAAVPGDELTALLSGSDGVAFAA